MKSLVQDISESEVGRPVSMQKQAIFTVRNDGHLTSYIASTRLLWICTQAMIISILNRFRYGKLDMLRLLNNIIVEQSLWDLSCKTVNLFSIDNFLPSYALINAKMMTWSSLS